MRIGLACEDDCLSGSPDLSFQVKFHDNSGLGFSRSARIAAAAASATAAAATATASLALLAAVRLTSEAVEEGMIDGGPDGPETEAT